MISGMAAVVFFVLVVLFALAVFLLTRGIDDSVNRRILSNNLHRTYGQAAGLLCERCGFKLLMCNEQTACDRVNGYYCDFCGAHHRALVTRIRAA